MFELAQRKQIYRNFSALFSYPDHKSQPDYGRFAAELAQTLDLPLPADLAKFPELNELETAYTGLFVNSFGGTPAPPYGSVYLDPGGLLMGESSLEVASCYAAENLNLEGSAEPPDFLATELEFFFYLLDEEEAALRAGNSSREAEVKDRQVVFFEKYFSPWIPEFCQRITAKSTDPFYLWLAAALQHFLSLEKQLMSPKVN